MNQPHSQPRSLVEIQQFRDRTVATEASLSQPLSLEEIERLLRLSNNHPHSQPAHPSYEDLLGPGDVQYLRGQTGGAMMAADPSLAIGQAPPHPASPDFLLGRAQQQMADAILSSSDESIQACTMPAPFRKEPVRAGVQSSDGLTLEDLSDIELDISIELGRAELLIDDVLKLRAGSVVSLDKLAGDPVDIMANGRLVARGELLVVEGKFGVRLSEVL